MLEVADLHAGYGRIQILNGVSFSLPRGAIFGVLGHNGMGKTTLLKTLIGELPVNGGSIRFDGQDVTAKSMAQRARLGIGYVPQGRQIFPQLSVRENLAFGEVMRGGASLIPTLLGYFPALERLLDRPGQALSGGEQQLLALARCLAGQPRVILLDEPTEGIQPSIVHEIAATLRVLAKELDLTVLLVEQDLHFIAALAERVLIIQRGRIIASLAPEQLGDPGIVREYLGL
ncbi:MAG TPA: ATP-binding cassette domain-containing protein [Candidatus Sulfotelmatobacter sp.]|nr:ATP-binding cassette domain-containing protein [Candidatus Sulfotelmatobacter sp.]